MYVWLEMQTHFTIGIGGISHYKQRLSLACKIYQIFRIANMTLEENVKVKYT